MRRLTVGEAVSNMAMAGTATVLYLTADSLWVKRANKQDKEDWWLLTSRVVDWSGSIRCSAPSALASKDGGAPPPPLTSVPSSEAPPPVRHRGRPRLSPCSPLKQRKWSREKGGGDGPYRGNKGVVVGVGRPYLLRGDEAQILLPKPRSTPMAAGRGSWRRLDAGATTADA
jgi:hypothetical protein